MQSRQGSNTYALLSAMWLVAHAAGAGAGRGLQTHANRCRETDRMITSLEVQTDQPCRVLFKVVRLVGGAASARAVCDD
jgi:hypothetical protein